jgi:hypothetical protein
MICDGYTKKSFFNFEMKIIRYSPIKPHKGHNFEYLQEGILLVSLLLEFNLVQIDQKFVQ